MVLKMARILKENKSNFIIQSFIFFTLLVYLPVSAHCKTINVGGEDAFYKTINAAIKSAKKGDIITIFIKFCKLEES